MSDKTTVQKETAPAQPMKKPTIWEAIPMITGAVAPIAKARQGIGVPFSFRGIDDVYAALNLLLSKHGVSILPEILENRHEEAGKSAKGATMWRHFQLVRFHLCASDGTTVTADAEGEGLDNSDKATAKSASTAYKSMAFQVFCIPTGEKIDSEEESPEVEAAEDKPADPSIALLSKLRESMKAAANTAELAQISKAIVGHHEKKTISDAQKKWLADIMDAQLARVAGAGIS